MQSSGIGVITTSCEEDSRKIFQGPEVACRNIIKNDRYITKAVIPEWACQIEENLSPWTSLIVH